MCLYRGYVCEMIDSKNSKLGMHINLYFYVSEDLMSVLIIGRLRERNG